MLLEEVDVSLMNFFFVLFPVSCLLVFRKKKVTKRRQIICPVKCCGRLVTNISRHLHTIHKWHKERALGAMSNYGLRKEYAKNPSKTEVKRDYHKYRICPFPVCESIVKRLDEHLRKSHKMNPTSEKYREFLRNPIYSRPGIMTAKRKNNFIAVQDCRKEQDYSKEQEDVSHTSEDNSDQDHDSTGDQELEQVHESEKDYEPDNEGSDSAGGEESTMNDPDPDYVPEKEVIAGEPTVFRLDQETDDLIERMYWHLTSPDGGNRDEIASKKVCLEVRRIYKSINALSLQDLLNAKNINAKYLSEHCKKQNFKANTIRKYLGSLLDFSKFLLAEEIAVANVNLVSFKQKLELWSKTYRKASRATFWERSEEEYNMLITPEQIALYEASPQARRAVKLFGMYDSPYCNTIINMKDYCTARDHLFFKIHFSTGHRSGVSANLTLKEFNDASIRSDGRYKIKVRKHKTFDSHGYANIFLERHVYGWLKIYIEKIRSQLETVSKNVFVSWGGKSMESGAVSKQIHELFVKAGILNENQIGKKITCNLIRKSASSGVRSLGCGLQKETADIMGHSVATAEKHYVRQNKEERAAVGGNVISQYFFGKSASATKSEVQENVKNTKRREWTKDEEDMLKDQFSSEIFAQNISLNDVREKFFGLRLKNCTEKQIYDKVRSFYRYRQDEDVVSFSKLLFEHALCSFM